MEIDTLETVKPYLDNRELSWLKFNQRVLEEAEDETVPLFERLRFVSIYCSNLDEFFMVRVGSLYDQTLLKEKKRDNKTNLTASEQLTLIADKVKALIPVKDLIYKNICERFKVRGIYEIVDMQNLGEDDLAYLRQYFTSEVLPLLTPSIIDKKHPVQFLKNKEIYIGTVLTKKDKNSEAALIGVLPATARGVFDRIVYLPRSGDCMRFVLVENLILHFVDMVFTNYEVIGRNIFRITRNADIDVNEALFDQDLDFRDVMEELIKKRRKLAPVRIEFGKFVKKPDREKILSKLNLDLLENFVFVQHCPLDMSFIGEIENKIRNHDDVFLKFLKPQKSPCINTKESILKQIEENDILLTYPYESFKPFILMLEEAAADPDVVSIKITLYRVARNSKIVEALIAAAESGKDVLVMVELRARFDEENNIGYSKRLEDAGVKVIYGLESMKVHSKLLLITKKVTGGKTGSSIRYYTQIGTGNYNERTSELYTDLTLLTVDQDIGTDASMVFNALSVGTTVQSTNRLWVAPRVLKSRVVEMIDSEITYKEDGYIGIKMNSLTDKDIIEKFVEASKKGVKIELMIRGICCLIAGIPGETENITVTSVVGRFLEHSRVYIFGKNERRRVYISSADFMTRNTERRVEVAAPILDRAIQDRIIASFELLKGNNRKARVQLSDGTYQKKPAGEGSIDAQQYLFELAYKNAENAATGAKAKNLPGFLGRLFAGKKK